MKQNLKHIASLACFAAVMFIYLKLAFTVETYMIDEFYNDNARCFFILVVNLLSLPVGVYGTGALIHIFKLSEKSK